MTSKPHPSGLNFVRASNAAKEVLSQIEAVFDSEYQIGDATFKILKVVRIRLETILADLEALAHHAANTEEGNEL